MILVTGGTGFLGAYILQELVAQGQPVRALRRSRKLPFFIPSSVLEKVEWVEGDVLDVLSLGDAMQGVDAVVHSAAVVSFAEEQRRRMYQVNAEGTANVVNAALDNGVRRMLHVSSVAALGRTTKAETVSEEKKWEDNRNNTHYARSKQQAEMHVWRGFAEGLDGVIINPSTILGFGDWHQSSCAIFRNAYKEFPWYSQGMNGFVGVNDAASVAVQLLLSDINHERFIVNADNWRFRKLFDTLAEGFGKKKPHREATRTLSALAWRLEKVRAFVKGSSPLLTKETAKIANSATSFDPAKLLEALPGFRFQPLEEVILTACKQYEAALNSGLLTL